MWRWLKALLKGLGYLILSLLFLISLFYWQTQIFDFPETKKFTGNQLFNPYEDLKGEWYKSNFHAHTHAWGGLSNGVDTHEEVLDAYQSKGYDVACITNYHRIDPYPEGYDLIHLPMYEHGFNILKAHKLAIAPKKVSFLDFPLYQSLSHKQVIVNKLKENEATVVIAHPEFGNFGHSHSEYHMSQLCGYELIEVLNHYRTSDEHWDAALSTGKLSWIIANDDTHNVAGRNNTFVMWTWVNSTAATPEGILDALITGKAYGVRGKHAVDENKFVSCTTDGLTVTYTFEKPVPEIQLIGQDGQLKHKAVNTNTVSYTFQPDDTYIRVQAYHHNDSRLFLNPVLRWDGQNLPLNTLNQPSINTFQTILFKIGLFLFELLLLGLLFGRFFRRK